MLNSTIDSLGKFTRSSVQIIYDEIVSVSFRKKFHNIYAPPDLPDNKEQISKRPKKRKNVHRQVQIAKAKAER